jgi:hypothetical protein
VLWRLRSRFLTVVEDVSSRTALIARRQLILAVAPGISFYYIFTAGLRGALGDIIPGALSILKGAVPGRARGFGHMAPTYLRRDPGIELSDGHRGSARLIDSHWCA